MCDSEYSSPHLHGGVSCQLALALVLLIGVAAGLGEGSFQCVPCLMSCLQCSLLHNTLHISLILSAYFGYVQPDG